MTGSPDDERRRPDGDVPPGGEGDLTPRLDGSERDPLESLLRPPAAFLSAPPDSYGRTRRRAARRRRGRAVLGVSAAVAVLGGTAYLATALSPGEGGDEVARPSTSESRAETVAPSSPGPSDSPKTAPPERSTTPSPDDTPTGSPSRKNAPPSGEATDGTAPRRCETAKLSASVRTGDAAAGSIYRYLVLTNRGSVTCRLTGYPGVSLLDADGKQLGDPATRDAKGYTPITLAPGKSASSTLRTINHQGDCLPTSTRVRVYPPGNTASLTAPAEIDLCDKTFTVTPLTTDR
ncbi:DUF4232 domain-containing protein [Streptomyces sp. A7024]|uniref:DUF4232 domain-containing protein n=1 Tax=Streptomyces coryli TaxID=1128680 RepID=A0A6G4UDL9_9ACTN|nr:DUF4232 domain-containing protein [Streptomyces coryli]NGN70264.1 DUF4232 domain-containing protein [Streptomyces coryli]